MGRKRQNNVYRHFMLQDEMQTSTCLLCLKTLNSIHGSNLMHHLRSLHKLEYEHVLELNRAGASTRAPQNASVPSNDEDSAQSEPASMVVDVEKFFTLDVGTGRATCDVCTAPVEWKNMLAHLRREHPKILNPSTEDSDGEDVDGNLYQEVVYLYDSDSKSAHAAKPSKIESKQTSFHQQPMKKTKLARKRESFAGAEERKRRRTHQESISSVEENGEELENFGKYITCLLKPVPKELCAQLQMEIINLIMTAKIRNMGKPGRSTQNVMEKVDNASVVDSSHNQSVVVTVLEENIGNVTVPALGNDSPQLKTECHL